MSDRSDREKWVTDAARSSSATDGIGAALCALGRELEAQWEDEPSPPAAADAAPGFPFQVLQRRAGRLVGSLGRFVIDPTPGARAELVTQAQVHERLWHRHDGDAGGFLIGLDEVSQVVALSARRVVASAAEELDNETVMLAFERLIQGLRIVTSAMLRQGVDRDQGRSSEVARRLAQANLALCHELRTPLYSMLLSTEVLEHGAAGSSVRRKQLGALRTALAHAEGLLLDATVVTRAYDGVDSPTASMKPLVEVFDAIEAELDGHAKSRHVDLEFLAPVPHAAVEFVVARLALCNLLTNAIKYSDQAKPTCWVKVRAESQSVGDGSLMLLVEVQDNGIGIPAALLVEVFERGYRAHPQLAEGSGLGLAITRAAIEDRGGSVELHSEEGRGTTVRLRLPAVSIASASGA